MESTEATSRKKERPRDLRKKAKRLEQSRDNLKVKNREKAGTIKKLSDRLTEISASRDHWRKQQKETAKALKQVSKEKETVLKRTVHEMDTLKEERDQLLKKVDALKKKRKRTFW